MPATLDGDGAPQSTGPAWVGIGAQRCGTTWFTGLLLQHPSVGLGRAGRKEMHAFDSAAHHGWTEAQAAAYRDSFGGGGASRLGEFTPAYLRMPWIAPLLRSTCRIDPVLIVLVRDPIDRFASAMRWYLENRPESRRNNQGLDRLQANTAVWAGMYAAQLGAWREVFPHEAFLVLQYERVRLDPEAAAAAAWARLGLAPVALDGAEMASPTATTVPYAPELDLDQFRRQLRSVYEPEVARLTAEWGIDPSLWPHFS